MGYPSLEAIETFAIQQLFIEPDGPGAARMRAALKDIAVERDERFFLSDRPVTLGVVTWKP